MKNTKGLISRITLVCLGVFVITASAHAQQCPPIPTLKIDEHTLDFSEKEAICVRRNGTFRIQLIPQNNYQLDHNGVKVREKSGSLKIRKKRITAQNVLIVKVGDFPVGTEPKYKIKVAGVGVLDPRVRITHTFVSQREIYNEIDDHLVADYGLTLGELIKIDDYIREEYPREDYPDLGFDVTLANILEDIRQLKMED